MTVVIAESGMNFGPYEKTNFFHIEKSNTYKKIHNEVRMAEFLLLRPERNEIIIIEAKTSAPNPHSHPGEGGKQHVLRKERFADYVTEIYEKLLNAMTLSVSLYLDRHNNGKAELPINISSLVINDVAFHLVLVIQTLEKEWLKDIQDGLQDRLRAATKTWPCTVNVINQDDARRYKLIQ